MSRAAAPACRTCVCWEPIQAEGRTGACHRFPPIAPPVPANGADWRFPLTDGGTWCGEYTAVGAAYNVGGAAGPRGGT